MAQTLVMRRDMRRNGCNKVPALSLAQNLYAQRTCAGLEVGMKNRFVTGVISGVLCTLVVCSLSFGVLYRNVVAQRDNGYTNESAQSTDNNKNGTGTNESTAVDEATFQKKLNYMKNLVNNFYLWDVNEGDYQTGMLKGMMSALNDPYSTYYTKEEYDALMETTNGIYYGIGATVSQNVNTGVITIVKPFVDGPAYKAGVLPGDILYKVEDEEVTGVDLTKVVNKMKGAENTKVRVTVIRENENDPIEITITRGKIEIPTIEHEMLEDKIGYISILEFDKITVDQYMDAIADLESQGMKGLVIDLRDNPGGLYDSAVQMLDRVIGKGLLVYTETKDGTRAEENAITKEELKVPLAVIVNGNSASASEIFAGAIQDYEKGTIVGTQSFGKGIVQSLFPLFDGSAVKVTVSNYFTPKGRSIHKTGITPDVVVELKDELKQKVVIAHEEDNQLQKAIEVVKKQIK